MLSTVIRIFNVPRISSLLIAMQIDASTEAVRMSAYNLSGLPDYNYCRELRNMHLHRML